MMYTPTTSYNIYALSLLYYFECVVGVYSPSTDGASLIWFEWLPNRPRLPTLVVVLVDPHSVFAWKSFATMQCTYSFRLQAVVGHSLYSFLAVRSQWWVIRLPSSSMVVTCWPVRDLWMYSCCCGAGLSSMDGSIPDHRNFVLPCCCFAEWVLRRAVPILDTNVY